VLVLVLTVFFLLYLFLVLVVQKNFAFLDLTACYLHLQILEEFLSLSESESGEEIEKTALVTIDSSAVDIDTLV